MDKEYIFKLTMPEGQMVVAALRTKPMEQVEALVNKLNEQFRVQKQAELDAEAANNNAEQQSA